MPSSTGLSPVAAVLFATFVFRRHRTQYPIVQRAKGSNLKNTPQALPDIIVSCMFRCWRGHLFIVMPIRLHTCIFDNSTPLRRLFWLCMDWMTDVNFTPCDQSAYGLKR